MATFRVGQRVRIVRVDYAADLDVLGHEAIIVPPDGIPAMDGGRYDYDIITDNGLAMTVSAWMLEPIQPERNQAIAWSECLWTPEHLREPA
jgi:hypothetical protein